MPASMSAGEEALARGAAWLKRHEPEGDLPGWDEFEVEVDGVDIVGAYEWEGEGYLYIGVKGDIDNSPDSPEWLWLQAEIADIRRREQRRLQRYAERIMKIAGLSAFEKLNLVMDHANGGDVWQGCKCLIRAGWTMKDFKEAGGVALFDEKRLKELLEGAQ